MRFLAKLFLICLTFQVLWMPVARAQEDVSDEVVRLANGVPFEGTVKLAAPEGITLQTSGGVKIIPWKYLSAGTRLRYERPMLAELEAKRLKAEKEAKAKAEAAAAKKATTNAPSMAGTNKAVTAKKPK